MGVSDLQDKVPVTLAGRDFVVKVVPMARVRRLSTVLVAAVQDARETDVQTEAGAQVVLDKILQFPYQLLAVFIDGLPEDIFTDEENGVTLPEFLAVLQTALSINRVDVLKNFFSRLAPTILAQASMPALTKS